MTDGTNLMDADDLCMGCMAERGGVTRCPECGWDERTDDGNPLTLAPRSVLAGQYLVGRTLGHGGFGIVYLAWDLNLELKLAIKEFMPDRHATRSPDRTSVVPFGGQSRDFFDYGLTQFLEEGRKIARFNDHPGIVPVLNFFRENGTGYLVMSYIPGLTLEQHLRGRGGRLPWQEAIEITMPVMDTLRAVHAGNLLHRDISPDNIYISHSRQVKLLDFGAARQEFGNKSKSLILKTGFAPKEQYQTRGNQGPWTDVYALGATLYCLVTGEIPPESLERNERDRLVPPTALGIPLPPPVEHALLKALAVNPESRFQTIGEMQAAIGPSSSWRAVPIDPNRTTERRVRPRPDDRTEERKDRHGQIDDTRRDHVSPDPHPRDRDDGSEPSAGALAWLVALVLPPARWIAGVVSSLLGGFSPAPDPDAGLRQAAVFVSFIVGVLGMLWGLNIAVINANPFMLAAAPSIVGLALLSGLVALVGNGALVLGAYLSLRADPRGPVIIWGAAWALLVYGVASFLLLAINLARVADSTVLPFLLRPAFLAVAWGGAQFGTIIFLVWKRRAAR